MIPNFKLNLFEPIANTVMRGVLRLVGEEDVFELANQAGGHANDPWRCALCASDHGIDLLDAINLLDKL